MNPLDVVEPPPAPTPQPKPPTPAEAARILNEASKDPDWGALIWTAMTTGARRGELCALWREDLDLDAKVLTVAHSMKLIDKQWMRLDTKTHQQRRIALDDETVDVLREHQARVDAIAAQLGVEIGPDGHLFTLSPDASVAMNPDTVTQRYDRMVKRLGIDTTLHKLRHYSATELIAAGVDVRTVAGRLGHGGGGTTTLKVYAAWVSEVDQRAATALANRLPRPSTALPGDAAGATPVP
jgi:integrase